MKSFQLAEKSFIKFLLIMKLTAVFILFFTINASADGFGQGKLNLKFKRTEIADILITIEKQSSYRFLYNNDLADLKQKVNLSVKDAELKEVLDVLFAKTDLAYQFMENNLVVIKEAGSPEASYELQATVTGKVTGENDAPLSGVSVQVKGTNRGATTNAQGVYSINVTENDVLVFSYVGYETQEIAVGNKTELNVALVQAKTNLEQVVVIGYGTASKRDLTGSIAKVTGKELADKPNSNPLASIQGKVAGVSVVNTGELGKEPDVRIRGTISRTQTKPLYVVDGIFTDNIDFLNPIDIESMEILKDPSSLAIFGVRGANGVIIITTKKAKTGQLVVNLTSIAGLKKITDKIELTDANQFKMLYDEQRINQSGSPYPNYNLYTGNSDWIDLISQTGFITNNNVSISGGTDKNKFYMGLGYLSEDGIIKHETLKKYILTINDEFKVAKGLKFGFNFNGYGAQFPNTQARDFSGAVIATPIVVPFNQDSGVYNRLPDEIGGPQIGNPLMQVEETKGTNLQYEYRALGSIYGEVDFLRHFNFRATLYGDLSYGSQRRYTPIIYTYAADFDVVSANTGYTITKVYQQNTTYKKYQQDYLLTYKNKFGEHNLTALAGFTTYFNDYSEINGSVTQPANGNPIPKNKRFWYLDNFFGDPSTKITAISHGKDVFGISEMPLQWEQATVSFLFRVLYNYKGKYMLNASFRRDGSSDISPDNRYQNFVSAGAAWELSKENFMQDQKVFDFLKLKASWGILGNQYTQIHYPFYPLLASGQSAVFGTNGGQVVPAYVPSFIADPDLKWETVNSKEAGVELRTLGNRLTVEANYYHKLTDNLLTNIPGQSGNRPGITNAGKIQNRGIEASVSWSDKLGSDFSYTISGNITTLNNKVKELYREGFELIDGPSRTTEGYPIGYFYGYIQEGIYQDSAEVSKSPNASSIGNYGPGDIKFRDVDGNDTVNTDDRTMIGNPTPDFIYGFSLGASYKGLDFSIDFQGVSGNDIFRSWGNGASYAPFNYRIAKLGRWTGPGTSNHEPVLNDKHAINREYSTYMIENGSYLRIRNIQIGYNFSKTMLSKIRIKALRIYLNGQNIKTFKHNSGFTPEFGGSAIAFGVDNGSYPLPAIYSAGINVTF